MIPKKIHYCRFGGAKPDLVLDCIASWKKYCPDYELVERNESNCDLNINKRVQGAVKQKKRAFVADYFRLKAIYEFGGVYLDTDMELLQSLDSVSDNHSFWGFDSRKILSGGIIGGIQGSNDFYCLIDFYNKKKFDGETINSIITPYFQGRGLQLNGQKQKLDGVAFYQSNVVSFDLQDGNCVVKDHHMNSWNHGRRVDHNARTYLEYLASQDEKIGVALDEIYATYTDSYIWKIGSYIVNCVEKVGLMKIASFLQKKFFN